MHPEAGEQSASPSNMSFENNDVVLQVRRLLRPLPPLLHANLSEE